MTLPPFAMVKRRLQPDPISRSVFEQLLANTVNLRSDRTNHWNQLDAAQTIGMIALMRDAFLTPRDTADVRWADLEYQPNDGAVLTFRRSEHKPPAQVSDEAIKLIWQACRIESATRKFTGNIRIYTLHNEELITKRIASIMQTAGLQGRYDARSPRDGMILDLLQAGHAAAEVAQKARLESIALIPEQFRNTIATSEKTINDDLRHATRAVAGH